MPHFTLADMLLIVVVAGLTVGMAYVYSPRAKSILFSLPLPFSAALISTGRGIDVSHVVGFLVVWAFVWQVWFFHRRLKMNIVAADCLALAIYCAASYFLPKVLPMSGPHEQTAFWAGMAVLVAAAVAMWFLPHRVEPGYRSPLPVYVKGPLVLVIVILVVLAKEPMHGFMTSFPFVTVFAVYESRHSLYTLGARMPLYYLAMAVLLIICRLLIPVWGMLPALGVGWAAFLPVLFAADAMHKRQTRIDVAPSVAGR